MATFYSAAEGIGSMKGTSILFNPRDLIRDDDVRQLARVLGTYSYRTLVPYRTVTPSRPSAQPDDGG